MTVAAPGGGPYQAWFRAPGVEGADLPLDGPEALLAVVRLVRAQRIEVVHSHGARAGLFGRLAAWWTGVPALHTFHGLHVGPRPVEAALRLQMERRLLRVTAGVIHVSPSQALAAARLGLAPAGKTSTIPNGVDVGEVRARLVPRPAARRALGLPQNALVLGTVARADPVKALGVLLQAMALLAREEARARLVVICEASRELQAQADRLGVADLVRFAGALADPVRFLSAFDLSVSASRGEGLPLALLEAMAAELPVVATRVTGHVDVVEEGRTGVLVPPDDPLALARAALRLLRDPARCLAMGRAAQIRARTHFPIEPMMAALIALYRQFAE